MSPQTWPLSRRTTGICIALLAGFMLSFGPLAQLATGQPAGATNSSPAAQLVTLGLKFNGASGCRGSGCHNKAGADAPPTERDHEYNIWKESDKHSKAFTTLTAKESTEIGTKLKIADVKTSDKCLSCHALNAPENLRGADFSIKEGNSCESCHGPSEKWIKAHARKGWQDEQRQKMNHEQLLKDWGLYDTRPLVVRAEMCTSCHLAIDAEMVAAGHPQPSFELAYYSDIEPKHWIDAAGFFNTKVWLAGQIVCTREAMQQLSTRAKSKASAEAITSAWQQAMSHASVLSAAAPAAGLDAATLAAHTKTLGGLAPTDTAKIAAEADAFAKFCADAKPKVAAWDPEANRPATTQILGAVGSLTGMGKFGQFGMDQQTMAISSLYTSYTTGNKKPAEDEVSKLITTKLFPEKPPTPAEFDANVAAVKAKLPK